MKMTGKKKIILDTNIYISAFLYNGLPRAILDDVLLHQINVLSEELIDEVLEKLTIKFHASESIILEFQNILSVSHIEETPSDYEHLSSDPDDDYLLALAEAAGADVLITGDAKHLLPLKRWKNTHICSPREYWEGKN